MFIWLFYNYLVLNIYIYIFLPQLDVNFQILLYFRNRGFHIWLLMTWNVFLKTEVFFISPEDLDSDSLDLDGSLANYNLEKYHKYIQGGECHLWQVIKAIFSPLIDTVILRAMIRTRSHSLILSMFCYFPRMVLHHTHKAKLYPTLGIFYAARSVLDTPAVISDVPSPRTLRTVQKPIWIFLFYLFIASQTSCSGLKGNDCRWLP